MGWFTKDKAPRPIADENAKAQIPDDIWTKCPKCSAVLYTRDLRRKLGVCTKCSYHFRLKATERISLLVDRHSFEEFAEKLRPADPLGFKDSKKYKERIKKAEKTGSHEAAIVGRAKLSNIPVMLGVMDFYYMGGSMGSVVGEKFTRLIEKGIQEKTPVIIVSCSGGARMQEGIYSLMQMAKISAALAKLTRAKIPFISVLTDPTTGGVSASYAMLGDVIIAEPNALIGFAGPRVIEQTIKQKLPAGFQRSEFLLEHGIIDLISEREELKNTLALVLDNLGFGA